MNSRLINSTNVELQPSLRNILLVDPDPQSICKIRSMLDAYQQTSTYQLHAVVSIDNAIESINHRSYDLILLDIDHNAPNILSLLNRLREVILYSPIIVMTHKEDQKAALQWMAYGVDDCIEKKQLNGRILSRMIDYSIERSNTYLKLHQKNQDKRILNALLQLSLTELPIEQLLQQSLEIILAAKYSHIKKSGGIFLADSQSRVLNLAAAVNLDPQIMEMCSKVPFGRCLCGRAAEERRLYYVTHVNELHENYYEGMEPHGHYNIPIQSKSQVLGVIVLYLSQGHQQTELELEFIHSVADTLAGIIERSNALIRLTEVHEQNSRVLESITSILIGVNDADRVTHWNKAAEEYFALSNHEVIGRRFTSIAMPWDWTAVSVKILDCMIENKKVNYFDVRFKHPDGHNGLLSFLIMPFIGLPGSHAGYLMIGEDVTEQKVRESRHLQQQKLQTIGQLAAGIAHEINTPIQYVGDNIQFLSDAFEDYQNILLIAKEILQRQPSVQDYQSIAKRLQERIEEFDVDFIQREIPSAIEQSTFGIRHVSKIVGAMKDFSYPGSEKKVMADINKAVENTVTVSRNVWKYYSLVEMQLDPGVPSVPCVIGLINEVILNVVVNAVDAIKERIGNDGESKGLIQISSQVRDEFFELRIGDTGNGIPEAIREHVFDPFFTTKEVGQGTGQGLSLSHSIIVDKHQGEFLFESEVGVGTTFIIRLPLTINNRAGE